MKLKRIIAYIIDSIFVSLITSMIALISFLNPTINEYNKTYKEYQQFNQDIIATESKIDTDKLINESTEYYYKLQKYSLSTNIIEIFCLVGYFVIFVSSNNGQSLGKKIMKIRIAPNKGNVKWYNYLVRMIILNGTWITILSCIMLFMLPHKAFYITSMVMTYIGYVIILTDLLFMLFRKDERSLHDIASNTKVIEA